MTAAPTTGLEAILLDNRARLVRFLAARGAGDHAEDVFHELWQKIAGQPERPVAQPMSYLFRAAENLMRDRHRADQARARREQDWQESDGAPAPPPSGERVLLARERLRQAEAVLTGLGERADAVFRRYRIDGMGQAEIARDLGVSLSTVEKDLQKAYRALDELREQFDAE
ncbi:RNA polymerase sigma-70 factor (ECF subfamily) [Hephaestia caeni]|uniref:RNA polymerase sigma-70 factor (ECF subfamily) n=1 Tax=Hephaestia caeni TaxID=645617 RepID=A0A397PEE7_9SPHN|nr:RNA polymerase sigma factor [Hephaestia caeni]RIA46793.1 RNA polymerase sigma-70 factor (ECF subfamily) [Hephaestia caeni]